jgi:hypothetical protein
LEGSVYGYVSANMLTAPRGIFAPAQAGDLPALLGAVHPRWRTPYVAIAAFAVLLWAFAQFASFSWNVTLSPCRASCITPASARPSRCCAASNRARPPSACRAASLCRCSASRSVRYS